MSCECDYDGDGPEFYRSESPKARKNCRCSECRGTIRKGEQYQKVTGKWDGHVSVFRRCPDCIDFEEWFTALVPCFCFPLGYLFDEAMTDAEGWEPDCPGLSKEVSERIKTIRAKRRELVPA